MSDVGGSQSISSSRERWLLMLLGSISRMQCVGCKRKTRLKEEDDDDDDGDDTCNLCRVGGRIVDDYSHSQRSSNHDNNKRKTPNSKRSARQPAPRLYSKPSLVVGLFELFCLVCLVYVYHTIR